MPFIRIFLYKEFFHAFYMNKILYLQKAYMCL